MPSSILKTFALLVPGLVLSPSLAFAEPKGRDKPDQPAKSDPKAPVIVPKVDPKPLPPPVPLPTPMTLPKVDQKPLPIIRKVEPRRPVVPDGKLPVKPIEPVKPLLPRVEPKL